MWYDVFVVAILIVGMVRGAVRGVVWQLAGIAGIVLCLAFAETISAIGAPLVSLEPPLNHWVVMFVAYLFFSFLSFGFARLIHGALEKAELKEYNKHLGAIFGLVKGAALCLVITFFLVTLSKSTRDMLKDSKSARYAAIIMDRLHPVMPEKLRHALATYIHDLDAVDLPLKYAGSGTAQPPTDGQTWDPLGSPATQPPANSPSGWTGSPFDLGTTSPASGPLPSPSQPAPQSGDAVDEMLKRIPGLSNDYLRDTVRQVYETTPPATRQQLLQDLQSAGPAMLMAVLQQWQSKPAVAQPSQPAAPASGWTPFTDSTQHVGYSQPATPTTQSLVGLIAARLAKSPQDQPGYEQYIHAGLQGLPDAVSLDVVKDWYADLTATTDPVPTTNAATTLDQRIIHQLTVHRVSVFQLSQELQARLMNARRQ